jgi:2-oxoglutarate ferredoxin oxidoreductase subunit gamma
MSEITQIRWSGFGGQGVVLAGALLGEAGALDGKFVSGSNFYGAQARGSICRAEIVFSGGPIDFPHVIDTDILIAMSQGSYALYCGDVKERSGIILYDQGQVTPKEGLNLGQIGIPATEHALKKLKNKQVANIVLLGSLIEATKIVSWGAMERAMKTHVSERFQKLNLEALKLGQGLGREGNG